MAEVLGSYHNIAYSQTVRVGACIAIPLDVSSKGDFRVQVARDVLRKEEIFNGYLRTC